MWIFEIKYCLPNKMNVADIDEASRDSVSNHTDIKLNGTKLAPSKAQNWKIKISMLQHHNYLNITHIYI